ncbi:MAG TPA: hypothetical protein VF386_06620, partial [Usitatibacter sp.]
MRTPQRRKAIAFHVACALAGGGSLIAATDASARITKLQITSTTPAYGGVAIGDVGAYERVVGKAFGEVSPTDSHNNIIVDVG